MDAAEDFVLLKLNSNKFPGPAQEPEDEEVNSARDWRKSGYRLERPAPDLQQVRLHLPLRDRPDRLRYLKVHHQPLDPCRGLFRPVHPLVQRQARLRPHLVSPRDRRLRLEREDPRIRFPLVGDRPGAICRMSPF